LASETESKVRILMPNITTVTFKIWA